ncbi:MAG: DUF934 domain-containing protein [Paracoccaceae bacterium]
MLIDRTGAIDDVWPRIEADAPLPAEGRAIVDFERLEEAAATHLALGVHLANTADPRGLRDRLERIALVSVAFPSFADGRGFSIARCLRQIGYRGRLRAVGPVISDQFGYLLEVGFDEVQIPASVAERQPLDHWLRQLEQVTVGYQRGIPGRKSILEARHGR